MLVAAVALQLSVRRGGSAPPFVVSLRYPPGWPRRPGARPASRPASAFLRPAPACEPASTSTASTCTTGASRTRPYRWLDLGTLCRRLLRGHTITRIRYFTALVGPRPGDPDKRFRQQTYIRALETTPGLSVHYGHFLSGPERMLVANPPPGGSRTVEVVRTQEKGSDVNLATYLLMDGFRGGYELAVVVSNDSDLKTPIELRPHRAGAARGCSQSAPEHEPRPARRGDLLPTDPAGGRRRESVPPGGPRRQGAHDLQAAGVVAPGADRRAPA